MGCESVDCKKIREWVFLYVDHEMREEMLVAFTQHISECPHCAKTKQHTETLLTIVRKRAVRQRAPGELRKKILAGLPHRRRIIPVR
jgi:mycothiol system anti-sigma-R factor